MGKLDSLSCLFALGAARWATGSLREIEDLIPELTNVEIDRLDVALGHVQDALACVMALIVKRQTAQRPENGVEGQ